PGWHIECSAMSEKYLGVPFDIHTGGIDHIPVHHENEIAQTKGASNKLEANYWMHSEFLQVDGGKMSKSLGNVYTIFDLQEKGFDPLALRYLFLSAHYRSILNFTFESLMGAQNALNRIRDAVRAWDKPKIGCAEFESRFISAINDDLDTPKAIAIMWELISDESQPTRARAKTLLFFDKIFGLGLKDFIAKPIKVPKSVLLLVKEREQARVARDFVLADEIRLKIENAGFVVEDSKNGQNIKEKR
ncbi:TPA: cysteine--tRNA ligase, partial [Candidatus Uhrbacteria bacterium]|nr:cysteine--tRNA ligase [Candidatus Uhrbacteria bacterium]